MLGVVPDVLIFDTTRPAAFPNGRRLTDDVVDLVGDPGVLSSDCPDPGNPVKCYPMSMTCLSSRPSRTSRRRIPRPRYGIEAFAVLLLPAAILRASAAPNRVAAPAPTIAAEPESSAQDRVLYYSGASHTPRLYPMYTQLGIALLDRTRESHDPLCSRKPVTPKDGTVLQDNFESLMAMASIKTTPTASRTWCVGKPCREGVGGGETSRDPAVTAALVESYLGFGKPEEPPSSFPAPSTKRTIFTPRPRSAAGSAKQASRPRPSRRRGCRSRSQGRRTESCRMGRTAAAGALIDSGRAADATAHLDRPRGWPHRRRS